MRELIYLRTPHQRSVDTLRENKATPFGVGAEECVCCSVPFLPSICEAFGKQQGKNPHMTLLQQQCGRGVVSCTWLCGNFGFLKWCGLALCQFKLDYHYQQQKTPVCLEKKIQIRSCDFLLAFCGELLN